MNLTYEGEWNSKSKLNKFEELTGNLKFSQRLLNQNLDHDSLLILTFFIYDGKYIENYYTLKMQNHLFSNKTNTYFNIDLEKNQMNASFSSILLYRSLYDKSETFSKKFNLIKSF